MLKLIASAAVLPLAISAAPCAADTTWAFTDNTSRELSAHGIFDETNHATWTGDLGLTTLIPVTSVVSPWASDISGGGLGNLYAYDRGAGTNDTGGTTTHAGLQFDSSLVAPDENEDSFSSAAVWSWGTVEFTALIDGVLSIDLWEEGNGWHEAEDHSFNVTRHYAGNAHPSEQWDFFNDIIDLSSPWTPEIGAGDIITVDLNMMIEDWGDQGHWRVFFGETEEALPPVPAPGALVLLAMAGLRGRRR